MPRPLIGFRPASPGPLSGMTMVRIDEEPRCSNSKLKGGSEVLASMPACGIPAAESFIFIRTFRTSSNANRAR